MCVSVILLLLFFFILLHLPADDDVVVLCVVVVLVIDVGLEGDMVYATLGDDDEIERWSIDQD